MQTLTTLYGQTLTLGLVLCGFVWMFSADTGREVAKRCGVSILLFGVGNTLWPPAGVGFFEAAIRILLALAALLGAFAWLVHPRRAGQLVLLIGALALGFFLLAFSLRSIARIVGL
jgi:hypothetical protein